MFNIYRNAKGESDLTIANWFHVTKQYVYTFLEKYTEVYILWNADFKTITNGAGIIINSSNWSNAKFKPAQCYACITHQWYIYYGKR